MNWDPELQRAFHQPGFSWKKWAARVDTHVTSRDSCLPGDASSDGGKNDECRTRRKAKRE